MTEDYVIEPIRKSRLSQKIVIQICELIRHGQIQAGNRLPPERELADRLQVSRASLREALSALEISGLIETHHGGGTYVRDFYEFGITSPLALVLSTSNDIVNDLWEVRLIFEPPIAARAAVRATVEEIETLATILKRHEQQLDDLDHRHAADTLIRLDREFHTTIARASRNNVSVRVLQLTNELLAESRRNFITNPGRGDNTFEWHTEIFNAIKARKPQAARDAMLGHLEEIERVILGDLVDQKGPPGVLASTDNHES